MDGVDKIVRQRVFDSMYWKLNCININAADICDLGANLDAVGGLWANSRPTDFLCVVIKLALIHPPREIIEELLRQPHFKYLTAVAAVYVRMAYPPMDIYQLLEPLLADYRKLRWQTRNDLVLRHMDELIDHLLQDTHLFDIALSHMPPRHVLEDRGLAPKQSLLFT